MRHYAWGSGLHIPRMLGLPPDGRPWAEMWIGSHPNDPSLLEDGTRLNDAVAADPVGMLGESVAKAFGRLPFMMKLLAAGEPLSLQVHPSSEQARLRFAAQEAAGIPADAPKRSYPDPSHKPELMYALTRFEGMAGFRDLDKTVHILREFSLPWLDELAGRLDGTDTPFQTLREAVTDVLTWSGPELRSRLSDLAGAASAVAQRLHAPPIRRRPPARAAESVERESLRVCQQTQRLAARYGSDPSVVVTLLLNHVVLAAGEAMFVPAGVVHAYTAGFGVEIMTSSDNVLRAGLTLKHIDVAELLRITDFRPTPPPRWSGPTPGAGIEMFSPPVDEFELMVVTGSIADGGPGPAILLCLEGEAEIDGDQGSTTLGMGGGLFARGRAVRVDATRGRVAIGRCPLDKA